MPKLFVVPRDVVDMLKAERIPLSILNDPAKMAAQLSAHDIADIHFAMERFPFVFDATLGIQLAATPFQQLSSHDEFAAVYNRVKECVDTEALKALDGDAFVTSYTLNPVDEALWVAVLQRQDRQAGDPGKQLLTSNHSFFDGVIAQVLHKFSFEKMCATNLFTYFLGSVTAQPA